MQLIFYLVAIIGSAYFLLQVRRFDFFTIGFASSILYFLPGFFGYVRSSRTFAHGEAIHPEVYAIFILVLSSILLAAILFDRLITDPAIPTRRRIPSTLCSEFALVISGTALAASLVIYGDALFANQKADVLAGTGRWLLLYRFAAIFAVVFAVLRRQKVLALAGFGLLLFDLFLGFRFGFVIALLCAAVLVLHRHGRLCLIQSERRNLVLGILVVGFVLVYKLVYVYVKLGLWDIVGDRLANPEILETAILYSEPFTTQSILNEIVSTNLQTGGEHFKYIANLLIPFATSLGAETQSFNALFQQQLFSSVSGGLANNFWAEMYSVGGWISVPIAIAGYVAMLALGSRLLLSTRGAWSALVVVIFTIVAFYIHRNDLGFELTLLRRCFFVWSVLILPAMLLVDVTRRSSSNDLRFSARDLS